ncbi:hypothetical protein [Geopsychrobacter electrodiphilus]|uniref:hypothetical protein n=1 Tax=Geopsychrobacter electrodiphilus TaxID=225196 RepID=UPI0003A554CA|nr:hypothetical protein [Geopsychrobacter electrodiphilus]
MKVAYFFLLFSFMAGPAASFMADPHGYGLPKELRDLPGMSAEGTKYMLGVQEADGVKGVAYLNDIRKIPIKYRLKQTHHLMVSFADIASGEAIESGSAEVRIRDPDANTSGAIKLFYMGGSFGGDVTLDEKGIYLFKIDTLLADGKQRTFHFHFENRR